MILQYLPVVKCGVNRALDLEPSPKGRHRLNFEHQKYLKTTHFIGVQSRINLANEERYIISAFSKI